MGPRKKRYIMLENDVDAAEAVTFKKVTVTKGGRTTTKKVKVHLFPPEDEATPPVPVEQVPEPEATFANDFEMGGPEPDVVQVLERRRRKVRTEKFVKISIIDFNVDPPRLYR